MKNLEIRIIGGEVFVPLYAVVELLKQANPVVNLSQSAIAQQVAIRQQANPNNTLGLGCHEEDFKGLSR